MLPQGFYNRGEQDSVHFRLLFVFVKEGAATGGTKGHHGAWLCLIDLPGPITRGTLYGEVHTLDAEFTPPAGLGGS